MIEVLHGAGIDDDAADRAYAAIHTYTVGFAAVQASRHRGDPPTQTIDLLAKSLGAYTSRKQFGVGLRYLLEGIQREGLLWGQSSS